MAQGDGEELGRHILAQALGPLNDAGAATIEVLLETQVGHLLRTLQAVQVEMMQAVGGELVGLDQRVGGTLDRPCMPKAAQHPAHQWQDTTPAIREALRRDPRLQVDVSEDIEDLAGDGIGER